MFTSASDIIEFIKREKVEFVDVRFCNLFGTQQHLTVPASTFGESPIRLGLMFDGSSMPGFAKIHESDMKLLPDLSSAFVDPFRKAKTLVVLFNIVDPLTDEPYDRDPRNVARRAEAYLRETGIADQCQIGAEAEFHLFDDVRFSIQPNHTFYQLDGRAAAWNTNTRLEGGNLGHTVPEKGGYFPVSPTDHFADVRDAITTRLLETGLEVERAHHEVGAAGQQEINYKYAPLLKAADDMLKFKYVVKNEALAQGMSATFMPKPVMGDNGSGMHIHMSLWKHDLPLFYDRGGYAQLSQTALWFIGGILVHAPALLAFTNPSTNSYRRLIPGFEAPVSLVYSHRNRSACIRIPLTGTSPGAKRFEFRAPDGTANPYLAFSACLMAGIDGIKNQIDPGAPVDKDLYNLSQEDLSAIAELPASLEAALDALEDDHEFLMAGNVFSPDLIHTWINLKRTNEVQALQRMPHPMEFQLYYST